MGKSSNSDYQITAGISLPTIVFIVFLILKCTDLISWSWWWVTSPLWIVAAIVVLLTLIYVAVFTCRYRKYKH